MTRPIPDARKTHSLSGPTIPQAIRDAVDYEGTVVFLQPDGSRTTFTRAQISHAIDQRAQHLSARGLKKGDRLGLVLPRNDEFVLTFMGALAIGVIPVPMYPPLSMGKLDAYVTTAELILGAAGACALVTEKKVQSVLWSLVGKVKGLTAIHCVEEMAGPAEGSPPDLSKIALDDVAFLQFTSGSTATPKGVVVTHRNLLAQAWAIMMEGLQAQPGEPGVSWLPLYHDMGLIGCVLSPFWISMPMTYIPTLTFVKHPTLWMETMHETRACFAFAPNFAYALARRRTSEEKLAKLDLSCVKVLGAGAEPNHPDTLRAFLDHFAKAKLDPKVILPCYGMAEATLAMTFRGTLTGMITDVIDADRYHAEQRAIPAVAGPDKRTLEFVSCGKPFTHHAVKVMDDAGRVLEDRCVGEIVYTGPSVTPGYYLRPDATAEVFKPEGLHTGDLGYLVDGELYVTGRKKDIIILNGRNYDPQSIEWEAAEVPGIRKGNVVAFSCPSESSEQLVIVAETKEEDHATLAAAVKKRVQESLFLNVADVVLLGAGQLPKTSSGKLQRRRTRQQYLDGELGAEGVRTLGSRGEALTLARHLGKSMVARVKHNVLTKSGSLLGKLGLGDSKTSTPEAEASEGAKKEQP